MSVGIFGKPTKGIEVLHYRNTQDSVTENMPIADFVYITMNQHIGPPCDVLVLPQDIVKVGQVIGNSKALFSAPIHSSVSGTVERIDEIILPNGIRSKAVVIRSDKLQDQVISLTAPRVNTKEDFIDAVRRSGMVGLGGAGFPTHVKLNPQSINAIDMLIINAAECEPYITADYRTLIEDFADAVCGIQAIMKHLGIPECVIGIEDDKPQAIELWEELVTDLPGIRVESLSSKYPQGAEKVMISGITGRVVPEGMLPVDVGVIVVNITTVASLARYLRTGLPLTTKRITVDGGAINQPKNVRVAIGTPISAVAKYCGGYKSSPAKILMGGPMMGVAVYNEEYPIMKNSNALLFLNENESRIYPETTCIRCGRCVRACPMNLMPLWLNDCFERDDILGLRHYKVNLCLECGCCAFTCPAKRHLVHTNRLAKARLREAERKEKEAMR